MDNKFVVGDIVKSLLGHDQNNIFIVTGIDKNGFLFIIDGKYRKRGNPKKKNQKHLIKIGHDDLILEKVNLNITTDTEIYNMLKVYKIKE